MKIKKIIILLIICLISVTTHAQKDSIFFKSGKSRAGNFDISFEKDLLFDKDDNNINFNLKDITKVVLNNKQWFGVDVYRGGVAKPYLAELVSQNEVSLLELSTQQGGFLVEKYFFLKNGKITVIDDKNLLTFYQVYFGKKFDKVQNSKYLKYKYNDIVSVLNNSLSKNVPKVVIPKRKYVFNQLFGFNIGHVNQKYQPNDNYFGNIKLLDFLVQSKNINFGLNYQVEFKHKIKINTQLNYQNLFFDVEPNDTLSYLEYFKELGPLKTNIYRADFSKSSLSLNVLLGKEFLINKNISLDVGVGIDINHTLVQKDASTVSAFYLKTGEKLETYNIRLLNFNLVSSPKMRFGLSGGIGIKYQLNNSPYSLGCYVLYTKSSQQVDVYNTFRNAIKSNYYNFGLTIFKKL